MSKKTTGIITKMFNNGKADDEMTTTQQLAWHERKKNIKFITSTVLTTAAAVAVTVATIKFANSLENSAEIDTDI
jgi:hypothetical protein